MATATRTLSAGPLDWTLHIESNSKASVYVSFEIADTYSRNDVKLSCKMLGNAGKDCSNQSFNLIPFNFNNNNGNKNTNNIAYYKFDFQFKSGIYDTLFFNYNGDSDDDLYCPFNYDDKINIGKKYHNKPNELYFEIAVTCTIPCHKKAEKEEEKEKEKEDIKKRISNCIKWLKCINFENVEFVNNSNNNKKKKNQCLKLLEIMDIVI